MTGKHLSSSHETPYLLLGSATLLATFLGSTTVAHALRGERHPRAAFPANELAIRERQYRRAAAILNDPRVPVRDTLLTLAARLYIQHSMTRQQLIESGTSKDSANRSLGYLRDNSLIALNRHQLEDGSRAYFFEPEAPLLWAVTHAEEYPALAAKIATLQEQTPPSENW